MIKGKACLEQDKANTRLVGEVGGRQIEDRMHGVMDGPEILGERINEFGGLSLDPRNILVKDSV